MNDPMDFSPLVAEYTKYRVGYGDKLFEVISRRVGAPRGGAALDLACGTGLSTNPLAALMNGLVVGTERRDRLFHSIHS